MLAMLYNTSSSRYRSFNRIYPSIIARKLRFRNTFQRYSDTTVPHFTFFHQHPSRQKSQTSALAVPLLPALTPQHPTPQPLTPLTSQHPAPHTQLTSKRLRVQVPDSRFLNSPVSQQHRFCTKSQTSHNTATSYAYRDCVII